MKINKAFHFVTRAFVNVTTPVISVDDLHAKLMEKLEVGPAHFVYENEKGELREAFGTLEPKLIPSKKAVHTEAMYKLLEDVDTNGINLENARDINDLVSEILQGHKPARNHGPTNQIYWDFDRQAFRSFRKEKLVAVY